MPCLMGDVRPGACHEAKSEGRAREGLGWREGWRTNEWDGEPRILDEMRSHRDGCANPSDSDETLCSSTPTWSGAATATDRAAGARHCIEGDAGFRAGWLRQDDVAGRLAGVWTGRIGR